MTLFDFVRPPRKSHLLLSWARSSYPFTKVARQLAAAGRPSHAAEVSKGFIAAHQITGFFSTESSGLYVSKIET